MDILSISDTLSPGIWIVWIPVVVGFLGCQIDSVLGATLEERGLLNKDTTNLVTIAIGVIIAVLLYTFFG